MCRKTGETMFLLLFLFVLITVSVPFALFFCCVVIVKSPSQFKKWLWMYVMAFALLAYSYTPTYENDLVRYYNMIENCRWVPINQAFTWSNDGLLIKNFWFWCMSKIEEPHLIQAIAIGSLYGVTAYITCDSFNNEKKRMWIVILFQLMLLPLHLANNNIRNMTTFALMYLAVYRDLVQKKRNIVTVILYVCPVFIHMAGLVIIGARLGVTLFRKYFKSALIATFTIPFAILLSYPYLQSINIPGSIGIILKKAIWKAYTSVLSNSDYARRMQESGYINACRVVMFIVCVSIIFLTLKCMYTSNDKTKEQYEFMLFNMIFCSITCIWIILGAVKFWAFGVASILGSGVLLSYYFERYKWRWYNNFYVVMIGIMGFFRALLEIYYISSRIEFNTYFSTLMTTNVWTVLLHILRVIIR